MPRNRSFCDMGAYGESWIDVRVWNDMVDEMARLRVDPWRGWYLEPKAPVESYYTTCPATIAAMPVSNGVTRCE